MKEHLELAVMRPTSAINLALHNDTKDRERVLRVPRQANGSRSIAVGSLGIGKMTLHNKLEEYGFKYRFK